MFYKFDIMENQGKSVSYSREPQKINEILKETIDKIQCAANVKGFIFGINTGFDELNNLIGGWQNGQLIVIGGRPAMGKTELILSMIKNIALRESPIPVALFSQEMNQIQITNALIANICEIPYQKLSSGYLESFEWERLDKNIEELKYAPIMIDDTPRLSICDLCNKAERLVYEQGVKIIFVDYLQLLFVDNKSFDTRYAEINYITRELKVLARELNIPIVVTSQLNRNLEDRNGIYVKRPQLTDYRDSGTICDDVDVACFIHRPEYYHITEDERGNSLIGLAEFIVAKNRMGSIGDVRLKFKREFFKFDEYEEFNQKDNFAIKNLVDQIFKDNDVPF